MSILVALAHDANRYCRAFVATLLWPSVRVKERVRNVAFVVLREYRKAAPEDSDHPGPLAVQIKNNEVLVETVTANPGFNAVVTTAGECPVHDDWRRASLATVATFPLYTFIISGDSTKQGHAVHNS